MLGKCHRAGRSRCPNCRGSSQIRISHILSCIIDMLHWRKTPCNHKGAKERAWCVQQWHLIWEQCQISCGNLRWSVLFHMHWEKIDMMYIVLWLYTVVNQNDGGEWCLLLLQNVGIKSNVVERTRVWGFNFILFRSFIACKMKKMLKSFQNITFLT